MLANIHNKETEEFFIKSFVNDPHAEGIMEVEPNADKGKRESMILKFANCTSNRHANYTR